MLSRLLSSLRRRSALTAMFALLALRVTAGALLTYLPPLIRDAVGLAGIGLIAYGAWLIYPPSGYIVGGLGLMLVAYLSGRGQA